MIAEEGNLPYDILFIDLDGTLIRSDLFFESILAFLKQKPLNLFRLVYWLIKSRAFAKAMIARHVELDVANLPYEQELIDYINAKRTQGIAVILATACHRHYANKVARHLGLFDQVIASTAKLNLKGSRKLQKMQEIAHGRTFAYAGDSRADRPIWNASTAAIHVNSSQDDIRHSQKNSRLETVIQSRSSTFRAFLKSMRMHQYVKNALIFAPLITSHSYFDLPVIISSIWGFVCFSLCASGVYFLNDLLDLPADRQHNTKYKRPLASGNLPLAWGALGAVLLPALAFGLASVLLPIKFLVVLACYFVLTNLYSFYLKRIHTVDVMTLAALYTLRVIAGGTLLINIEFSSWLLAFSVFTFASLAFLKRYIELAAMTAPNSKAQGRGYSYEDKDALFILGASNSTASILVLSLYISSPAVSVYYAKPQLLWFLCLLMLYWTNRLWIKAKRGKIHDDPVVFAIKDSVSRAVLIAFISIILLARFL